MGVIATFWRNVKGDAGRDENVNVSLLAEYVIFTVSGVAPNVFAVTDMTPFVTTTAGIPDSVMVELKFELTMPAGTFDVIVIGVAAPAAKVIVIGGIARPIVKFREGTFDVTESVLDATVRLSVFDPDNPSNVVAVTTVVLEVTSVVGVPEIRPVVEILSPLGRVDAVYRLIGTFDGYRVVAVT
jgi:hypothetical protein